MLLTPNHGKQEYIALFNRAGAIVPGFHHLTKGAYTPLKVEIEKLRAVRWTHIVDPLLDVRFGKIDGIVAVNSGGGEIGLAMARRVRRRQKQNIFVVETEKNKTQGHILDKQSQELVAGKLVLAIDDVLTTGLALWQTIQAIVAAEGIVAGGGVVFNRAVSGIIPELDDYRIGYCVTWQDFPQFPESLWQLYQYGWQTPKTYLLARQNGHETYSLIGHFRNDNDLANWLPIDRTWGEDVIVAACTQGKDPILFGKFGK